MGLSFLHLEAEVEKRRVNGRGDATENKKGKGCRGDTSYPFEDLILSVAPPE